MRVGAIQSDTSAQVEALSRPRFARPDVEGFEPVAHYPGTAALMLIAMCFTVPLAIYGAIHAGRAAMVWLLGVM